MRIAIISDIHSNIEALIRAFEIIDENKIDTIMCTGDIVGYAANHGIDLQRKPAALGKHRHVRYCGLFFIQRQWL